MSKSVHKKTRRARVAVAGVAAAVRVSSVNGAAVTGKPAQPPIMNHFVLPGRGQLEH